ncbi:crossover junction endodeoxyribonuclease RuvC [Enterococcus hulanensis]|uniref:crossover junction endodeoxyribonuclease RuvC n=1 Tax=Enterococcus hulanensis TaxID=2559929 RepID=UPI0010F5427C|nr:crossover junction endodeoxyribonuclease RuvC [Enterococcus hulanensis]
MNLIAFDQSTTATGWCVMEMDSSKIVAYGVIRPIGPTNERIRETIKKCMSLCKKFEAAFVFIEGIQVQRNPTVYEILAKLKGTLEICLEERGYFVNVVKAAEWRKRVGIKNKKRDLVKQEAIDMVKDVYDLTPSEDECEAILFARAFSAKDSG